MTEKKKPALSLILCSRNDEYMGNSRWRLHTILNYVAGQIAALKRECAVEVLVSDWGSDIPLREVLPLSQAAAKIVSYIHVSPDIASALQKDSPFPEVLALNAAVRRAEGEYIGRIDQDTLVGPRFLKTFFELCEGRRSIEVPLESALLFSNVRMVPYRFAVRCPPILAVEQFIRRFGEGLPIEVSPRMAFFWNSVGIWLCSKSLWHECGGYDEEMLYMNSMEIDMIYRLLQKYRMVDLGKLVNYDFYHLEHYHPWVPRKSSVYRTTNAYNSHAPRTVFNPNDEQWGLARYSLPATPSAHQGSASVVSGQWGLREEVAFSWLLALVKAQMIADIFPAWCAKRFRHQRAVFLHRLKLVRDTIRGKPVGSWYRLLHNLWIQKRAARYAGSRRD